MQLLPWCSTDSDATTEEDMRYMIQPAQVHVGDSVNVFRHGTYWLVLINAHSSCDAINRFTSDGTSWVKYYAHIRKTNNIWYCFWINRYTIEHVTIHMYISVYLKVITQWQGSYLIYTHDARGHAAPEGYIRQFLS